MLNPSRTSLGDKADAPIDAAQKQREAFASDRLVAIEKLAVEYSDKDRANSQYFENIKGESSSAIVKRELEAERQQLQADRQREEEQKLEIQRQLDAERNAAASDNGQHFDPSDCQTFERTESANGRVSGYCYRGGYSGVCNYAGQQDFPDGGTVTFCR